MNTAKIAAEAHGTAMKHLLFSPFPQPEEEDSTTNATECITSAAADAADAAAAATGGARHDDARPRIEHTISEIPAGPLLMVIQCAEPSTQNHVSIKCIQQDKSPLAGIVQPGDWLVAINGISVVGETLPYCADLLRDAAQSHTRTLRVAREIPNYEDEHEEEEEDDDEDAKDCGDDDPTLGNIHIHSNSNNNSSAGKENNISNISNIPNPKEQQSLLASLSFLSPLTKKKKTHATLTVALPSSAAAVSAMKDLHHEDHPTPHHVTEEKAQPQPPTPYELFHMTVPELREEIRRRGWPGDDSEDRDAMLEDLGVPVCLWKSQRALTVKELKDLLRAKDERVSGKKPELLQRLGVPLWFLDPTPQQNGSTGDDNDNADDDKSSSGSGNKSAVASKSHNRKKHGSESLEPSSSPVSKKLKTLTPHLESNHMDYELACCDAPRFDCLVAAPAGAIWYPDGSMADVWRCLECGQIPHRPNAPPVQECRDDDAAGILALLTPQSDDDDNNNVHNRYQYYEVVPDKWEPHIHHYKSKDGECVLM